MNPDLPNQNLSPDQFSDWLGPTGSYSDPAGVGSLPATNVGVSDWTAAD